MTAPAFTPAPSTKDFGPDHTATKDDPKPPKINVRNPPKPSVLDGLGTNKKLRSPIRKLSEGDEKILHGWYLRIGKVAKVVRPTLGEAITESAEDCARTWCELADKNDKVRHFILGVVEGGEWGKVITAHLPIFMAVIPEAALNRIMLKGMGMFAAFAQAGEDNEDDVPDYITNLD